MDILTTIPVRLNGPDSIAPLLENVRQRIARRAYENFIERGAVYGHDLDNWLDAEREFIIKPFAETHTEGKDVFVEVILPKIELTNLAVHVAPGQFVISSDPEESLKLPMSSTAQTRPTASISTAGRSQTFPFAGETSPSSFSYRRTSHKSRIASASSSTDNGPSIRISRLME